MKKISLFLIGMLFATVGANALTVNNPVGADGRYIVKWDCAQGCFAASNDFEVNETFVFAVDVTGTPYEAFLKELTNVGATRAIAFNKWGSKDAFNGDAVRLKQIQGNIYGATFNLYQELTGEAKAELVMTDSILYVYGQIFCYEYTADNPGAAWWLWPAGVDVQEVRNVVSGVEADAFFATLPYTGTKTSAEFYSDDYTGMFEASYQVPGYAAPCAVTTDIDDVLMNAADVVTVEYYNLLGMRMNAQSTTGIYIKTIVLSDGSRVSEKVYLQK